MQLLEPHGAWDEAQWARLFESFRALQLTELVVQWTVHDRTAFFSPATDYRTLPRPPLATLLRLAQQYSMRVLVGLAHDPAYWNESDRDPRRAPALFDSLLQRSAATAQAVLPTVAASPAFAGWYITEEVDDLSWSLALRPQLFAYLARLGAALRSLTPNARIALSGFTDARSTPAAVEVFWRALLSAAPDIDCVLFQDGIGVAKLEVRQFPAYLGAVARAARAHDCDLQAVVETFRQTGGLPVSDGPFAAEPAPLARILSQMQAAAGHASQLVAFSVPEYMSPQGGARANALYRDYLAHFAGLER